MQIISRIRREERHLPRHQEGRGGSEACVCRKARRGLSQPFLPRGAKWERQRETDRGRGETEGAGDRDTRTQSLEDAGRGGRAVGKGAILREAAWTESPGHRGLAALQSRQKPGQRLERRRAPAARQQASPLCSQPWTSCTLSPSPQTPLCALPAVTQSHALSITHDYTCPSPCSTQPRVHSGWQDPGAPGLPGR